MIKVCDLNKGYGKKPAVEGISLVVNKGEVHGLIGENSAGKTTLIKCLVGLYKPDNGSVTLDGKDVYDCVEAKERIAYIADTPDFVPIYSVAGVVKMYNNCFKKFNIEKFNEYNKIFNIPMNANANRMSKGQKMRLNIMLEMSKGADFIIMDEPTGGLDPVARGQFFDMVIKEVEENGTGILISSHNLDGLEKICDTVSVISKGQIDSNMTINDTKEKIKRVNAVFENGLPEEIKRMDNVCNITNMGKIYSFSVKAPDDAFEEELKRLGAAFVEITEMSLEEYFISLESFGEKPEAK